MRPAAYLLAPGLVVAALVAEILWLDPALSTGSPWRLLALNALSACCAALALWIATRRALVSLLVVAGLVKLLFQASAQKMQYLGTPLLPSDFWLATQVIANPELFSGYAGLSAREAAAGLAGLVALAALWRFEPRSFPRPRSVRVLLALVLSVLAYGSLAGTFPTQSLYAHQFGGRMAAVWDPAKLYARSGFMNGLGFLAAQARLAVGNPDLALLARFDARNAEALARRARVRPPQTPPDIFVIQSESLFDPGLIEGLDGHSLMPNWDRLSARGIHGSLQSPAYGGVTIRAEFEVLTGYPMRAFPTVHYPYYGLVKAGVSSLPRELDDLGYATIVAHPYHAGFWNRSTVMQRLGFEDLMFERQLGALPTVGRYPSDEAFFNRLLRIRPESGRPAFVFGITMENHGPWARQVVPDDIEVPTLEGLSPTGRNELRAYLWHVRSGDAALGRFADRLLARERPTVLAIYGDHLPALKDVYPRVRFRDGHDASAQPVPFMILSNRALTPRRVDDSPLYRLPALLLEAAGLPQRGFFAIDGLVTDGEADIRGTADPTTVLWNATWRDYRRGTGMPMSSGDSAAGQAVVDPSERDLPLSFTVRPEDAPGACSPDRYVARVAWTIPLTTPAMDMEVHVKSVDGEILSHKRGKRNAALTGAWVRPGMRFFLVDLGTGKPIAAATAPARSCPGGPAPSAPGAGTPPGSGHRPPRSTPASPSVP